MKTLPSSFGISLAVNVLRAPAPVMSDRMPMVMLPSCEERKIVAKKIDEGDYRGTAGSSYFDIEGGDIAVLSSGGGVSLTATGKSALVRDRIFVFHSYVPRGC